MNHAITVGGLLLTLGVIAGLLGISIGALMMFAAGMSDAGDDGTGKTGCIVAVVGLVMLIGSIILLLT